MYYFTGYNLLMLHATLSKHLCVSYACYTAQPALLPATLPLMSQEKVSKVAIKKKKKNGYG